MSVSNVIRMAGAMRGMNQSKLAEALGTSAQALNNKFHRESWSAADLVKIAEVTGGKLALVYPDGQQLLFLPEEDASALK